MVGRHKMTLAVAMMLLSSPIMQGRYSKPSPISSGFAPAILDSLRFPSDSPSASTTTFTSPIKVTSDVGPREHAISARSSMRLLLRGGSDAPDDGPVIDMPRDDDCETMFLDDCVAQSLSADEPDEPPVVIDVDQELRNRNGDPAGQINFAEDDEDPAENTKDLLDFFVANGRIATKKTKDDDEEDTIEDEYYRAEMDGQWSSENDKNSTMFELQGNNTTVRNETHLKILDIHLEDIQTNNLAEQRERFVQSLADTRDLVNPFQQQSSDPLQVGNWVSFKTEEGGVRYGVVTATNETDFVYIFRKHDWDLGTDRVNISLVSKVDMGYWDNDEEELKKKKKEKEEDANRFQELTFDSPKFEGLEDDYNIEKVIQKSLGTFDEFDFDDAVDGGWNPDEDPTRVFPQRLW